MLQFDGVHSTIFLIPHYPRHVRCTCNNFFQSLSRLKEMGAYSGSLTMVWDIFNPDNVYVVAPVLFSVSRQPRFWAELSFYFPNPILSFFVCDSEPNLIDKILWVGMFEWSGVESWTSANVQLHSGLKLHALWYKRMEWTGKGNFLSIYRTEKWDLSPRLCTSTRHRRAVILFLSDQPVANWIFKGHCTAFREDA